MNRSLKNGLIWLLIVLLVGLVFLLASNAPRRWLDNALYDNYNHYLNCNQLPLASEVQEVWDANQSMRDQITALSPAITLNVVPCEAGGKTHADVLITYASHAQRVSIEELLQGKTFFSIPARWLNN